MTIRRAAPWLVLTATLAVLAVPAPSTAATQSNQLSASYITSYLTLAYNSQWCSRQNRTKYQIVNVEQRWHRSTTARRISKAQYHYGELGFNCNGAGIQVSSGNVTFNPCFNCGSSTSPNWTPSYVYWPPNWPYLGLPELSGNEYVGTWVKTWIVNGSGTQTGFICNQVYLFNARNGPC